MKADLQQKHRQIVELWNEMEVDCEVFARARMYRSFNSAMKLGLGIGGPTCIYALMAVPSWSVLYVFGVVLASIAFSFGWIATHSVAYTRTAYIMERLHMRAVFLGQMIGG